MAHKRVPRTSILAANWLLGGCIASMMGDPYSHNIGSSEPMLCFLARWVFRADIGGLWHGNCRSGSGSLDGGVVETKLQNVGMGGSLISFSMDVARAAAAARRLSEGSAIDGYDVGAFRNVVAGLKWAAADLAEEDGVSSRGAVDSSTAAVGAATLSFMKRGVADSGEVADGIDSFSRSLLALLLSPSRVVARGAAERLGELSSFVLSLMDEVGDTRILL